MAAGEGSTGSEGVSMAAGEGSTVYISMARRSISEKGRENGNKKKGKERLMKQKAGPRTITEEEKKKKAGAWQLRMGINGFLNVGQIKTSHLILIMGNLGCRGNSIPENMIRKNFKKGKNCIIPVVSSRTLKFLQ